MITFRISQDYIRFILVSDYFALKIMNICEVRITLETRIYSYIKIIGFMECVLPI